MTALPRPAKPRGLSAPELAPRIEYVDEPPRQLHEAAARVPNIDGPHYRAWLIRAGRLVPADVAVSPFDRHLASQPCLAIDDAGRRSASRDLGATNAERRFKDQALSAIADERRRVA